jgi:hypothetical protein
LTDEDDELDNNIFEEPFMEDYIAGDVRILSQ